MATHAEHAKRNGKPGRHYPIHPNKERRDYKTLEKLCAWPHILPSSASRRLVTATDRSYQLQIFSHPLRHLIHPLLALRVRSRMPRRSSHLCNAFSWETLA